MMIVPCPSCGIAVNTFSSKSNRWRGDPRTHLPLASILREAGLSLVEDWIACFRCEYNGWPKFTKEEAADFGGALEREGNELMGRREFRRARRRYVRALAVLPDHAPALIWIARTFMAEADAEHGEAAETRRDRVANYYRAQRLLAYADAAGIPQLPYLHFLLGIVYVRLGRWEEAQERLTMYLERDKAANEFSDFPEDASDKANAVLFDLPQLWARSRGGKDSVLTMDAWTFALWDGAA